MQSINLDSLTSEQQDIPDFILKLYNILENQEFLNTICWSGNGCQVQIKNQKRMEDLILPTYFRHQKIQSFIRQLNMYRFKKVNKIGTERKYIFFRNELFRKGNLKMLHLIVRKKKGQQEQDIGSKLGLEEYKLFVKQNAQKIHDDINALRKRHPQMLPQLLQILNSASILTGESNKQNSETDESQQQSKNLSPPGMLFVSNDDLEGYQFMSHFDSKCSIDLDLQSNIN